MSKRKRNLSLNESDDKNKKGEKKKLKNSSADLTYSGDIFVSQSKHGPYYLDDIQLNKYKKNSMGRKNLSETDLDEIDSDEMGLKFLPPLTDNNKIITYINAGILHISNVSNLKFRIGNIFNFNIKNLLLIGERHSFRNSKLVSELKLGPNELAKRDEFFFGQFEKFALENKLETMIMFEGPFNIIPLDYTKQTPSVDTVTSLVNINSRMCKSNKNVNGLFFCKYTDYRLKFMWYYVSDCFEKKIKQNAHEDMITIKTKCKRKFVDILIKKYCEYNSTDLIKYLDDTGVVDSNTRTNIYKNLFCRFFIYFTEHSTFNYEGLSVEFENDFQLDNLFGVLDKWISNFCLYVMENPEDHIQRHLFSFLITKLKKHIISDEVYKENSKLLFGLCIKSYYKLTDILFIEKYRYFHKRYIIMKDLYNFLRINYTNYNVITPLDHLISMIRETKSDDYPRKYLQFKKWLIELSLSNKFLNYDDKTFLKTFIDYLTEKHKSGKLIRDVDSSIREILFALRFCSFSMSLVGQFDDVLKLYYSFNNFNNFSFLESFIDLINFQLPIFELFVIMCLYCKGSEKNIVVQAGNYHINKIVGFLSKYNNKFDTTDDRVYIEENKIKEHFNYFFNRSN